MRYLTRFVFRGSFVIAMALVAGCSSQEVTGPAASPDAVAGETLDPDSGGEARRDEASLPDLSAPQDLPGPADAATDGEAGSLPDSSGASMDLVVDSSADLGLAPGADLDGGGDPPPVDCSRIEAAADDWTVCLAGEDRCEAVYEDGAGCTALCAAAGLVCTAAYENRDGACAPDLDRATLPCDSGHRSDFCVCGGDGVALSPDPGPPLPDSFQQLLDEREGYGAGAQGGDPEQVYVVTTRADRGTGSLRAALESTTPWWIVFDVEGTIRWEEQVYVKPRKTVDGRGKHVVVDGTWRLRDAHDVILSDLELTRSLRAGETACEQSGDVVNISGRGGAEPDDFDSRDIWLHHLWLHSGGDGLVDIRGGTRITISWCRFSDHKKVSLAWKDDEDRETSGMWVTWHHNHFAGTSVRNPRFHYGRGHLYNNLYEAWWQYGIASYDGAEVLSEANVFEAAADCFGIPGVAPCVDRNPCGDDNDWFVDRSVAITCEDEGASAGRAESVGDLFLGGAVTACRDTVFRPSYDYDAQPASPALAEAIEAGAGPRLLP